MRQRGRLVLILLLRDCGPTGALLAFASAGLPKAEARLATSSRRLPFRARCDLATQWFPCCDADPEGMARLQSQSSKDALPPAAVLARKRASILQSDDAVVHVC